MSASSSPQVATTVISHSFLRCLESDASSTAGKAEPFALVVVNGDVGHFLAPLWTNGQRGGVRVRLSSPGMSSLCLLMVRPPVSAVSPLSAPPRVR